MPITYKAIATVTVGSGGTASFAFTSIPQTYTDLAIRISGKSSDTQDTGNVAINMKINTATTGYTGRVLYGYGSTIGSFVSTSQSVATVVTGGAGVNSMFSNHEIYICNYTSSNAKAYSYDTVCIVNSTALADLAIAGKNQSATSAITDLTFTCSSGNFVQYSTATLYGIKNS